MSTTDTIPCLARYDDGADYDGVTYICDRDKGHDGAHVASDGASGVMRPTAEETCWHEIVDDRVTGCPLECTLAKGHDGEHRDDEETPGAWISIHAAARLLGLTPWAVYRMVENGMFRVATIYGRRYVSETDAARMRCR